MDYINNELLNPKYLFHGSPYELNIIERRQAHDSNGNKDNEDYAVFLTSSFIIATAYAFMDTIKNNSKELDPSFEIGFDADEDKIFINFSNVNINDDIEGYVYVVQFDESYEHHGRSIQYKSHNDLKPIDIIKIKFSDFKNYYNINNDIKSR